MGTRGAWGFRLGAKDKISVNWYDSYFSGLGQQLIEDFKTYQRDELVALVEKVQVVHNFEYGGDINELQKSMIDTLEFGYMENGRNFLNDSLFCEYVYIFNLDDNVLEIYRGFQEVPEGKGRYHGEYYPVALFTTISLDELPEDLDKALKPLCCPNCGYTSREVGGYCRIECKEQHVEESEAEITEVTPMKVFCATFEGMFIGGSALVVAEDINKAKAMLKGEFSSVLRFYKRVIGGDLEIEEVKLDTPRVHSFENGDY